MSWFSQQWERLNRAFEDSSTKEDDNEAETGIKDLDVVWGRERLSLSLPPKPTPHTVLSLKGHLSELTSLPPDHIKIIYHGLILRDDKATLRSYNIRSGSRIMIVGSNDPAARGDRPGDKSSRFAGEGGAGGSKGGRGAETQPRNLTKGEELAAERRRREEDRSEEGITSRIDEVLANVRNDVEPKLLSYEGIASGKPLSSEAATTAQTTSAPSATSTTSAPVPTSTSTPAPQVTPIDTDAESLKGTQRLLNELLSRALLALDAIPNVSEPTRLKRKEAVKWVQSLIDRLDQASAAVTAQSKGSTS